MKNIWNRIKENPNRTMFLIPIFLVAVISISHVVSWYNIANPYIWSVYLSLAIEIGAITALVAATNKIKGGIWVMFGVITFIQMVGNIFFSYKEIDTNGDLFKSWVELTGPIWEMLGTEQTDVVGLKRWLAFLEGGLLPIISLTSLHFFVKYEKPEEPTSVENKQVEEEENESVESKVMIKHTPEVREVFNKIKQLRKEGKLYTPTKEDLENEPTALAFTPNMAEDESDEDHALDMVMNGMVEDLMEEEGVDNVDDLNEKLNDTTSDDIIVEEPIQEVIVEESQEGILQPQSDVEESFEQPIESIEIVNKGIELNKTWRNVMRSKRRTDKKSTSITKLGE